MGVLDGMSLTLTGAGTVDLLTGLTTVFADSRYEIYGRYYVHGDIAIDFGVTVNLTTNDYKFAVMVNYGHKGSSNDTPSRAELSVTFDWGAGSQAFDLDDANGPVLSGQAIPPTIWVWNSGSQTVTETFLGKTDAFRQNNTSNGRFNGLWKQDPTGPGAGEPYFCVRFDPDRETTYKSMSSLTRCACYGGSWIDPADGKRVRPDLLRFHCHDGTPWYKHGSNWWLSTKLPSGSSINGCWDPTTNNHWDRWAAKTHNTSGNMAFCQCIHYGGEEFQTNPAMHMLLKQVATRFLALCADPSAGYGHQYDIDYQNNAMRAMGRPIGIGAWIWQALYTLQTWRPNDTELADLANAVGTVTLNIFDHIWKYRKPRWLNAQGKWELPTTGWFSRYSLPPEEPALIGWWVNGAGNREYHPDAGGSKPLYEHLSYREYFMGELFWEGLYHLWDRMDKIGLSGLPDHTRCRVLMDSILIGVPGIVEGIYDEVYKWGDASSGTPGHPFDPPATIPPSWASRPACSATGWTSKQRWPNVNAGYGCWPEPKKYTVGGYGWCWCYHHFKGNDNNDDLAYLNAPSTATMGQGIAMFEFAKREGMINERKLNEIIVTYAHKSYHWHLQDELVNVKNSTLGITSKDVKSVKKTPTNSLVDVRDSTLGITSSETHQQDVAPVGLQSVNEVRSTLGLTSGVRSVRKLRRTVNGTLGIESKKIVSIVSGGQPKSIVDRVDSTLTIGDPDAPGRVTSVIRTPIPNANDPIYGSAVSVNPDIEGEGESVKEPIEGTGTSVNPEVEGD